MENQKDEILDRVAELFCKYGIKSVSMDDVAKEMGMSKKTLYLSFRDKADLIEQSVLRRYQVHFEWMEKLQKSDLNAIEQILEINKMVREIWKNQNPAVEFDLKKFYPDLFRKMRGQHTELVLELMQNNVELGRSEGLFRTDFNSKLISYMHFNRIHDFVEMTDKELGFSREEAVGQLVEYHLRGICTKRGIEELESHIKNDTLNENKE